jgi:putative oxidoreductase
MNAFLSLGRWLFMLPFAIFGLFHFMGADGMAGMVPSYLPGGVLWVYLTGAALVAATVSMAIGKYDKLAATLLAVFLLILVLLIHLPGAMAGDQSAMSMMLKDIIMAGAAMMYATDRAQDKS